MNKQIAIFEASKKKSLNSLKSTYNQRRNSTENLFFSSTGTYRKTDQFFFEAHEKRETGPKKGVNLYAGGMLMPGRNFNSTDYRFGFNGKEKDAEIKGEGNSYDYGFRIYDPRIGRFLSVDPLTKSYPFYTPYQFAGNSPIKFIDLDGLEEANPAKPGENKDGAQTTALDNARAGFISQYYTTKQNTPASTKPFSKDDDNFSMSAGVSIAGKKLGAAANSDGTLSGGYDKINASYNPSTEKTGFDIFSPIFAVNKKTETATGKGPLKEPINYTRQTTSFVLFGISQEVRTTSSDSPYEPTKTETRVGLDFSLGKGISKVLKFEVGVEAKPDFQELNVNGK